MPDVVVDGLIVSQPDPAGTPVPVPVASITVSPRKTVKLTRRKTNVSQTILLTVNKDDVVTVNGVQL